MLDLLGVVAVLCNIGTW